MVYLLHIISVLDYFEHVEKYDTKIILHFREKLIKLEIQIKIPNQVFSPKIRINITFLHLRRSGHPGTACQCRFDHKDGDLRGLVAFIAFLLNDLRRQYHPI